MIINSVDLSNGLIIEIGKFAILWNCFERDFFNYRCNPHKIINSYDNIYIDRDKQHIFANVLNKRRLQFNFDIDEYVEEGLHPSNSNGSTPESTKLMKKFIECPSEDNRCGCLLIILKLRNNLMHGLKDISELDKQIELFQAINLVLESIKRI